MAKEFRLPELGENIASGEVVRVVVSAGETVRLNQTVVELETDKAVVEVPSTIEGTISNINVHAGQTLKVGDVLFTYEADSPSADVAPTRSAASVSAPPEPFDVSVSLSVAPPPPRSATPPSSPKPAVHAPLRDFHLPELGENITAGDVVKVSVSAGDALLEGQTVMELETDKAVVEIPAPLSGRVAEVKVKAGERIKVGDLILTLAASEVSEAAKTAAPMISDETSINANVAQSPASVADDEFSADPTAHGIVSRTGPSASSASESEPGFDQSYMAMTRHSFRSARAAEGKSEEQAFPPDAPPEVEFGHPAGLAKHAGPEHRTVPASPLVRKLAREIGIDIYLVKGTGPGGRISEDDVKAFAKATFARLNEQAAQVHAAATSGAAVVVKLPDFSRWGKIEKVSLRGIRRKTAEHLALAWNQIPHVTQFDKADVTDLEELRKRFAPKAEKEGGKLTMTAIALKVVASALKAFPQFNAAIDVASEEIVYKKYFHIGVAVDTDRGLLVPVIRDVDRKNIIELSVELSAISKKARDRKLTADEMEGGTFTITNLGGVGGTAFTPIVNHPEVAILGMSRSRVEPVWIDGKFEPRTMLPLSLSYDHRIIDGADAARFARWIVDALEQPFLLSVQG